jgi:hypothetical protein
MIPCSNIVLSYQSYWRDISFSFSFLFLQREMKSWEFCPYGPNYKVGLANKKP